MAAALQSTAQPLHNRMTVGNSRKYMSMLGDTPAQVCSGCWTGCSAGSSGLCGQGKVAQIKRPPSALAYWGQCCPSAPQGPRVSSHYGVSVASRASLGWVVSGTGRSVTTTICRNSAAVSTARRQVQRAYLFGTKVGSTILGTGFGDLNDRVVSSWLMLPGCAVDPALYAFGWLTESVQTSKQAQRQH